MFGTLFGEAPCGHRANSLNACDNTTKASWRSGDAADCKFTPIFQKNNVLEFGEASDISRTERECLDTPSPHLIACAFTIGALFTALFWGGMAVLVF